MKWSELDNNNFYECFDENQRAIKGFWLTTLGVNLENLPITFNEHFIYFHSQKSNRKDYKIQKVYLSDIVGTSHKDYGDMEIIKAYIRSKRTSNYIKNGLVTKRKYNTMLKKPIYNQDVPIILSRNKDGKYFVDGNGNHRIILYKIMMLAEIASQYSNDSFYFPKKSLANIQKKYWIYAYIND